MNRAQSIKSVLETLNIYLQTSNSLSHHQHHQTEMLEEDADG